PCPWSRPDESGLFLKFFPSLFLFIPSAYPCVGGLTASHRGINYFYFHLILLYISVNLISFKGENHNKLLFICINGIINIVFLFFFCLLCDFLMLFQIIQYVLCARIA